MFKRPAFFALVASAVVGAATLVSTAADANPHGGRGGAGHHRVIGHGGHGGHGGHRMVRPGLVRNPGMTRHIHGHGRHLHLRPHLHLRRHVHLHHRHHSHGHHHHRHPCFWRHGNHFHGRHCHRHHAHWHWRSYWVGTNYVRTYPVARPVAASCTCLRKTYLPTGAVLFEDVCTNESAINPPAQAAEMPVPQK